MSNTMPNLWAHSPLSPVVKTPVAILRAQTAPLAQATQGLLRGDVTVTPVGEKIVLTFDVIAPSLNNYRRRLVTVEHSQEEIFPAKITGNGLIETFQETDAYSFALLPRTKSVRKNVESKIAYSEDDFVKFVHELIQAPVTTALLQSLIARSNDPGEFKKFYNSVMQTRKEVDEAIANPETVSGSVTSNHPEPESSMLKNTNGPVLGVQTGGHAVDGSGASDTRSITEKAVDTLTGDNADVKIRRRAKKT